MTIAHISAGAVAHRNDDHVAVFNHGGATDILVIDGGTSVAEGDYLDPIHGDVTWFVHSFTAALEHQLRPERSQQECVQAAVDGVRARFEEITDRTAVPLHAWPIAALTWIRIGKRDGRQCASLYGLGDCKSLLRTAAGACIDLDPFVNPQDAVLQAEIAKLRAKGVTDPVERRERMLPMLRERRKFQNTQPAPAVLCLHPNGAFNARIRNIDLEAGASLLIMTDGFYRLVDPYGRYTDSGLADACIERGLPAMLDELRTYEAVVGSTGARAVKAADDASAAIWTA
ncbi:protein phosphatase 2C domain-containing protein [Massilia sp. HP4]|uniref:protein phosphatase 2C domain-containing protein n=1 Tax=Massilia sp. HP4 TaxID=2562316 RepID=UPI0010C06154|nr:protein phosphatase 2C domain-containing protein [Massilia sp. HP4]